MFTSTRHPETQRERERIVMSVWTCAISLTVAFACVMMLGLGLEGSLGRRGVNPRTIVPSLLSSVLFSSAAAAAASSFSEMHNCCHLFSCTRQQVQSAFERGHDLRCKLFSWCKPCKEEQEEEEEKRKRKKNESGGRQVFHERANRSHRLCVVACRQKNRWRDSSSSSSSSSYSSFGELDMDMLLLLFSLFSGL